jgi:RNA polymerase sigma factor (sigma-70 family)
MAEGLSHLIGQIHREAYSGKTDRELLQLFVQQPRDEAAFEVLVKRHGGMVWGVCRRIVGDHHDAEDAFQAAFLCLARKANQLGQPDLLCNWLHGVARNLAWKVKAKKLQQRAKEESAKERQAVTRQDRSASEADVREWREVLDAEIDRLPVKYRTLLIQYDLEGKPLKELAAQRKCPLGTIKGELARARERLRNRLLKRGLTLSGSVLAGLSAGETASAAPPELAAATAKGVALWMTSGNAVAGTFSAKVIALTEEMMRGLLMSKIKIIVGTLAAAVFVFGSTGGYLTWGAGKAAEDKPTHKPANQPAKVQTPVADEQPKEEPKLSLFKMEPLAADPKDDELRKLLKECYNAALAEAARLDERVTAGKDTPDRVTNVVLRLRHVGLELFDDPKEKLAFLQKVVELTKHVENVFQMRYNGGSAVIQDLACARYYRADAEIALLRLKRTLGEKPK